MSATPDSEKSISLSAVIEKITARFFTASDPERSEAEHQKVSVLKLRAAIIALGVEIENHVPEGRNKSLALTALEDVQMRANRGIFATGPFA